MLLQSKGNEQGSAIEMRYGDQAQLQARLDQQSGKITGALLSLGLPSSQLQDGFYIDVNLEQAELLPWLSLLQNQLAAITPSEDALFPALTAVNGRIGELQLFDDVFLHQLRFHLTPQPDSYQLNLNADEAQGDLWFSRQLKEEGLKADLTRLQLIFANQQVAKLAAAELKAQQLLEAEAAQKPDYAALEAEAFAKIQQYKHGKGYQRPRKIPWPWSGNPFHHHTKKSKGLININRDQNVVEHIRGHFAAHIRA